MQDQVDMTPILTMVKKGLMTGDPRFTVMDREHVMDNLTGYEFHFYPDRYHVTKDGVEVYSSHILKDRSYYGENTVADYIRKMLNQHFYKVEYRQAIENRKTMYGDYMNPKEYQEVEEVEEIAEIGGNK